MKKETETSDAPSPLFSVRNRRVNPVDDVRLQVFRAVVKHLSFTKASRELFISQPAISKHISELEKAYNLRLFERRGHMVVLTPAGRVLSEHAEAVLKSYDRMNFAMARLQDKTGGALRIGASTTISQYVLPEILAAFTGRYPDIRITLMSGNSREVEAELTAGHIDVGLVEGIHRQVHLHYEPLMEDELVCIVAADNATVPDEELTPADLCRLPVVLREQGSGTLEVIESYLRRAGLTTAHLNICLHVGTTEGIKQYVKHTQCLGIVSVRAVRNELLRGEFRLVELSGMKMLRHFCFVEKQGAGEGNSKLLQEFITKNYR